MAQEIKTKDPVPNLRHIEIPNAGRTESEESPKLSLPFDRGLYV